MINKIKKIFTWTYWRSQKHLYLAGALLVIISGLVINIVGGCSLHLLTNRYEHDFVVECRGLAEKTNKDVIQPNAMPLNFEAYYNPKLKKCFYCGGYNSNGFMAKFIIDVYTNKEIISYAVNLKEHTPEGARKIEALDAKKRELFNEK